MGCRYGINERETEKVCGNVMLLSDGFEYVLFGCPDPGQEATGLWVGWRNPQAQGEEFNKLGECQRVPERSWTCEDGVAGEKWVCGGGVEKG